jgi:hypothetical protein
MLQYSLDLLDELRDKKDCQEEACRAEEEKGQEWEWTEELSLAFGTPFGDWVARGEGSV